MKDKIFISGISHYFTQEIVTTFFVKEVYEKKTQENEKPYLYILLQDNTGTLSGIIWEENMNPDYLTLKNEVVQVNGIVTKSSNNLFQIIISRMEKAEEYDITNYTNGITEQETKKYTELLWKYISLVQSKGYHSLLEYIFQKEKDFYILPATLNLNHNYNGGLLVLTLSITAMVHYQTRSLQTYNIHPSYTFPYNTDLCITAALLHGIGIVNMLTPFPNMGRVNASIPLSTHEHTTHYIQNAILMLERDQKILLSSEEEALLFHTVGSVYEDKERKAMVREAILLYEASNIHKKISMLEHFINLNKGELGFVYDKELKNYLYIKGE